MNCEDITISDEHLTENIFDNNYTRGYDLRYNVFYNDNETTLFNIKRNFKYKSILTYLKSDNNTVYNKYKLLEENDLINETLKSNISEGGLLDDWNYTF
tara:strand:- start:9184 stop:9480 length:297 start_codon:yes stop_codon:yes gene_type:complete